MKIRRVHYSRLGALSVLVLLSLAAWPARPVGWFGKRRAALVAPPAPLHATFAELPLIFEANAGQTDARVRFLAQGSGYRFFLTAPGSFQPVFKGATQDPFVVKVVP